jgi:large-conductance mechanosensitive channel
MHADSWKAYGEAIQYLATFFLAAALIAIILASIVVMAGSFQREVDGEIQQLDLRARIREHLPEAFLYSFGFALFGTITAYFLSQGLTDASGEISNPLVASFVTPFVALLTGAVTFVASRTRAMVTQNDVVLGVVCFLLSCVLSYEAMKRVKFDGPGQVISEESITSDLGNGT